MILDPNNRHRILVIDNAGHMIGVGVIEYMAALRAGGGLVASFVAKGHRLATRADVLAVEKRNADPAAPAAQASAPVHAPAVRRRIARPDSQ